MLQIKKETDCCGCASCVQRCPKQCIKMGEDAKGFLYPKVDVTSCIDCGLCEKVCPVINQGNQEVPLKVLAVRNKKEEDRINSSSGGYFRLLSEHVIDRGGVVFGASFDKNWEVCHSYTETAEGLKAFMGSKYVQSRIENTFAEAESFLKSDRMVLYSGTSCQISGLKHFLRKDYDNLFTVEVVCHGVPSPMVWRDYLATIRQPKGAGDGGNTVSSSLNKIPSIEGISFRDKLNGWKDFCFVVRFSTSSRSAEKNGFSSVNDEEKEIREYHRDNLFMRGFLNNLFLRPICFDCPAKSGKSGSDFSLADFWAIDRYCPWFNDDKGVTLVHINSKKAVELDQMIEADRVQLKSNKVYNRSFILSASHKYDEEAFWAEYSDKKLDCIGPICTTIHPSYIQSLGARFRSVIKRFLLSRS